MDLLLLAVLAIAAAGGYKMAVNWPAILDNSLAKAMGLPIGLLFLTVIAHFGSQWCSYGLCLAAGIILLGAAALILPKPKVANTVPPFTYGQQLLLLSLALVCIFYVHSTQLTRIASDFWFSYPLTRSLTNGNMPPVHPFFPWMDLNNRNYQWDLIAALSGVLNNDTLRAQWILELTLIVNGILLWAAAIRKISESPAAGALGALFAFVGVNVGGKVGLMDAFDNGDLLIFTSLAVILSLYGDIIQKAGLHWPISKKQILFTAICGGIFGNLCETYLLLVLICFMAGAFLIIRRRQSAARLILTASLACTAGTLLIMALLGSSANFTHRTVKNICGLSSDVPTAAVYSEPDRADAADEHVSRIKFPKKHFLSIRLGSDPYQRYSSSFNNAVFRHYRPLLDDGGYSFIFSYRVLLMHWLPTWLAPLTLAWAVYRRSTGGYMFGLFALIAYFTPAIIDLGPIQEPQYFRWEFAAGLGFAILTALTAADLWDKILGFKPGFRRGLCITLSVIFILCNLAGAQRLVNNIIISAQCVPGVASQILFPWYPPAEEWLLRSHDLKLNNRDAELGRWLREHAGRENCRVLFAHRKNDHEQLLKCAAINGLAGTLSCEHAFNPAWLPIGTQPYLPNETGLAWQSCQDPAILAGSGVNWLITEEQVSPEALKKRRKYALSFIRSFGSTRRYWLYKVCSPIPYKAESLQNCPQSEIKISLKNLPVSDSWPPGYIKKAAVQASQPLKGWLKITFADKISGRQSGTLPVTCFAEGSESAVYLTSPLDEGQYALSFFYSEDGSEWRRLSGGAKIKYQLSKYIDEHLRVQKIEQTSPTEGTLTLKNIGGSDFVCLTPLQLKGFVWSDKLHNYRNFSVPENLGTLKVSIPAGQSLAVPWKINAPIEKNARLDICISAPEGQNISVPRL
ncbi:hypothetical protein IJT93_09395 [bacterium]|nr:hypothetical protein [bacterium]